MTKHARVLLVEDDEDDYILTSDSLQQLDSYTFDIHWVTTPDRALEKLMHGDVDICLLDYQLGARSGLDVLRMASEQGCLTPIIMLTGQTDDKLDKSALDAGAVDYLNKEEINTARFARAVRYALARNDVANERLERIKAETQNRSKDRFLAHLSHELRTPLTSILGYAELLLGSEKAAQAHSELNIILSNGKHLLSLLNDVLDLSKIAADKLELNPSRINLDSFIADVFFLLQINAQDKGLTLAMEARTELPLTIQADATRLRQILINLTYNAIKFTEQGQVSIYVSTRWQDGQEKLFFEVIDTGIGIPAERLNSIFEPFEQIEDIVTRRESGAGLGLAICTELVKRMGGQLEVESNIGEGSCFQFAIYPGDISDVPRQRLSFAKPADRASGATFDALSGHILVVDDAPDIRQLLEVTCQNFGLSVETAHNGLQALEKCREALRNQTPYDVVLMDIHMPAMDGRQAITAIRQAGYLAPVIAVTAAALKGIKQSLKRIGFNEVLHKPLNIQAMYQCLSEFLVSESPLNQADKSWQVAAKVDRQQSVLLVEDDPDAAEITAMLLQMLGAKVGVAHSAAECLASVSPDTHWDKILLDLHLPDMSGLQLAGILKMDCPASELILVSGAEVRHEMLVTSGIQQALLKPLNKQKLAELLATNTAV